jgi:hypothetical protein
VDKAKANQHCYRREEIAIRCGARAFMRIPQARPELPSQQRFDFDFKKLSTLRDAEINLPHCSHREEK